MGWSSLDSIRSNRALSAGTLVQVCGEALDGPLRAGERPATGECGTRKELGADTTGGGGDEEPVAAGSADEQSLCVR